VTDRELNTRSRSDRRGTMTARLATCVKHFVQQVLVWPTEKNQGSRTLPRNYRRLLGGKRARPKGDSSRVNDPGIMVRLFASNTRQEMRADLLRKTVLQDGLTVNKNGSAAEGGVA